ncbi:hypothetical protein [Rhodococcoides fascians]|uniref:hypothetical protein n=1 Tax=Rhodococcoides fascians TaxID=1828 RepID=UPI00056503A0|nr:hypothetical protein [Rhodococcus fascians]
MTESIEEAMARIEATLERTRPARERRAVREAEAAAWVASVDDAVADSLNSVLDQRHSKMLGPLPRQRDRARHALTAAVGRWFRDAHPTIRVDDYPAWADQAARVDHVGQPAHDPEPFPWQDPAVLAAASVLGDGAVAAVRTIQNYYLPKKQELSWMDAVALDEHIAAADSAAAEAAKYVSFDDDRCLRDGQDQK